MAPRWQRQRSEFNHDWLKNRFLPALAKWVNILDGRVEDLDFQREFTRTVLAQWPEHGPQSRSLAERFAREMSPATLFDREPLSRMPEASHKWMGSLVHELWMSRYPIQHWVANTITAYHDANEAFESLQEKIGYTARSPLEDFRALRSDFVKFQSCCQALARTVEEFPSNVLVV